jgi:DNA-3-methyladenine glycosylase II
MQKALHHLSASDPVMARIVASVGPYRIRYREPDFSTLVRSILNQQVSGASAATVIARLLAAAGRGDRFVPSRVAALGVEGLRPLGVSRQKASYILDLATRRIPYTKLAAMNDEEVIARLTEIRGIGVWTAHMFLMFALRRHDILPTGDLGVRNAMQRAYQLPAPPPPAEMERIGEPWRPYRSVASWYLWRSLEGEAQI